MERGSWVPWHLHHQFGINKPHNWISFRINYQHDLLCRFVVPNALVLMGYPVFALAEGGAVWRSSTQRTFGHRIAIAVGALEIEHFNRQTFDVIDFTHLLIRYFNSRRQLSADIIWIFHLTSCKESRVTFALKPLHLLSVNIFTLIHASLQIAVQLIQLLLNVPHSFKWHVEFH